MSNKSEFSVIEVTNLIDFNSISKRSIPEDSLSVQYYKKTSRKNSIEENREGSVSSISKK